MTEFSRRIVKAKPQDNSAGVSMAEILISLAVLGVVLVAVAGMMTGNLNLRRTSVVSTAATQLASSYLEAVKGAWSIPLNYEAPVGQSYGPLPSPPSDARYDAFTLGVDISCLTVAGTQVLCSTVRNPELREVRVTVLDQRGTVVSELITQIGRPFEPGRSR